MINAVRIAHAGEQQPQVVVDLGDSEMDAGDIWASCHFQMKQASKSHLYRHEVTDAAIKALLLTVERFEGCHFVPEPLDYSRPDVKGTLLPSIKQIDRRIDWSESTETIARKIRCADSQPGILDEIAGTEYYLYGAHEEDQLTGKPGEIIAWRDDAICRATGTGSVWITHLKRKGPGSFKVPAAMELTELLKDVPESPLNFDEDYHGRTYREIWYEENNEVGYLHFDFYNGAMSTDQCNRLRAAYLSALKRNAKVIVLMGGADFWSNGIHLNTIEAAENPADESWENINAINNLIYEIITTDTHLVISAMQGNAGAGGVILALAADYVYARRGVMLHPHYKGMGLYGSEYWTYLLPKRIGQQLALEITEKCISLGTAAAKQIGLIDDTFSEESLEFQREITHLAERLARSRNFQSLLEIKNQGRFQDEQQKPVSQYRNEELAKMWDNFYSPESTYHEERRKFVYKICPSCSEIKINHLDDFSTLKSLETIY